VTRHALQPHEELVLLVAGTSARRRANAGRLRELLAAIAWDRLLAELTMQRLVPLLGGRVLELAGTSAPAAFAEAVREQTDAARHAGALMELATLRVAAALETAGIANVPLKGPLLARSLHGDAGMRFSRDIDVLVGREDLQRAAAALEPLGWRSERGAGEPVLHLTLAHGSGLPEVELHWRLHWYEAEFAARALARTRPGHDGVRRLQDVDELTALLLYHARDGFAGLRHAIDAAAWWDAHAAAHDRVLLAPVVSQHPALARALSASAAVLEQLVGVPADRLMPGPSDLPWGARRAVTLANPLMRGTPEQITAEITLVDALLAPEGQRRAFVRRRVLVGRADLPPARRRRSLAAARAEHVLRVVRRLPVALVRQRAVLRDPVSGRGTAGRAAGAGREPAAR
jgi:Uncharacterised nucleotidyltransferase